MDNTQVGLDSTQLKDRILWYDGDSTMPEYDIIRMVSSGVSVSGLFVDEVSPDIQQYNALVSKSERITVKSVATVDPKRWIIPEPYASMDPVEHVLKLADNVSDADKLGRLARVGEELVLYEDLGLIEILKVLIYIINTLQTNNIVWGVGRGSSVSSYVLHLIGVHDVDSYAYDLPIEDFLH